MDRPKLKDTMRTQPGIIELISPAVLSASPPLPPELPEPWIPIALPQPIITNKAMPTNSAKQEARQTLLGSFIWVFAIASHGRCDGWDGCDGVHLRLSEPMSADGCNLKVLWILMRLEILEIWLTGSQWFLPWILKHHVTSEFIQKVGHWKWLTRGNLVTAPW